MLTPPNLQRTLISPPSSSSLAPCLDLHLRRLCRPRFRKCGNHLTLLTSLQFLRIFLLSTAFHMTTLSLSPHSFSFSLSLGCTLAGRSAWNIGAREKEPPKKKTSPRSRASASSQLFFLSPLMSPFSAYLPRPLILLLIFHVAWHPWAARRKKRSLTFSPL